MSVYECLVPSYPKTNSKIVATPFSWTAVTWVLPLYKISPTRKVSPTASPSASPSSPVLANYVDAGGLFTTEGTATSSDCKEPKTLQECKDLCTADLQCKSFAYNPSIKSAAWRPSVEAKVNQQRLLRGRLTTSHVTSLWMLVNSLLLRVLLHLVTRLSWLMSYHDPRQAWHSQGCRQVTQDPQQGLLFLLHLWNSKKQAVQFGGMGGGGKVCRCDRCQRRGKENECCGEDDDCENRRCVNARCRAGNAGDPCGQDSDCINGHCVKDICRAGNSGDLCEKDEDCDTNACVNDRCKTQNYGSKYDRDSDCGTFTCGHGRCTLTIRLIL